MIKIFFTTKYTKKHEDFFILISLGDLRSWIKHDFFGSGLPGLGDHYKARLGT